MPDLWLARRCAASAGSAQAGPSPFPWHTPRARRPSSASALAEGSADRARTGAHTRDCPHMDVHTAALRCQHARRRRPSAGHALPEVARGGAGAWPRTHAGVDGAVERVERVHRAQPLLRAGRVRRAAHDDLRGTLLCARAPAAAVRSLGGGAGAAVPHLDAGACGGWRRAAAVRRWRAAASVRGLWLARSVRATVWLRILRPGRRCQRARRQRDRRVRESARLDLGGLGPAGGQPAVARGRALAGLLTCGGLRLARTRAHVFTLVSRAARTHVSVPHQRPCAQQGNPSNVGAGWRACGPELLPSVREATAGPPGVPKHGPTPILPFPAATRKVAASLTTWPSLLPGCRAPGRSSRGASAS